MPTPKAIAPILLALLALARPSPAQDTTDLAKGFQNPPDQAKPHTWWHWMNGNITKEGITADLEAMKQVGLGGSKIFNVSENIPAGPILFMSPEWRSFVKHAATEANRLGLELCIHNCAGWSSSGGPWITPENAMQTVVTSEIIARGPGVSSVMVPQPEAHGGLARNFYRDIAVLAFPSPRDKSARIKDIKPKAGYDSRYGQDPALDAYPPDATIDRPAIVDVTKDLAPDGKLTWQVPPGDWTILRIGYTPTGAVNAPSPDSGRGLEVDKLSREAFDTHWAGMMGPLLKDLGPLGGKTLNNCLIDSYEVGQQNWSPHFREEFQKRRGYDPIPLLPVLTGRVVDSGEISERFLWDLRRTIADLFADNYYSYFAETCRKNGLKASVEPYDGPFECLLSARDADIPMGEFWVGGGESTSCKLASSVAHTYGQKIIGAESFTAEPNVGRWRNHPYSLKAVGDLMYTTGINRYIIHRFAHQPWVDAAHLPGMTMGQWGTHFERTNTWWTQGSAWVRYLSRCQFLLQQGLFSADVVYLASEDAPNNAPFNPALKASGYDYDACSPDVVLHRMSVKDGRLVLPDGMSYRLLVLPDTRFMTPTLVAKLRDLVRDGATVIGPKPTKSPSLNGYPDCDTTLRTTATELWGDCDGQAVKQHAFGKGRVIWGLSPEQTLAAANTGPDCSFTTSSAASAPKTVWIHRSVGPTDLYFVSNQTSRSTDIDCSFRISGRDPELWHADTGQIEPPPPWSEHDGHTTVPIHFDPSGSVFVVFRKPAASDASHLVAMTAPKLDSESAPAIQILRAAYEAVDGAGTTNVTAKVAAMVAAGQTSIPASNATYGDPAYLHVKRLRVEYTLAGKPVTATVEENGTLELQGAGAPAAPPTFKLASRSNSGQELQAFRPGTYTFQTAAGTTITKEIKSIPTPQEISGPWTIHFQPGRGAPPSIVLDHLASLTAHTDPGVRYFSGTAEYEKEFDVSADTLQPGKVLYLDLGRVHEIAEVTLNGQALGDGGVLWKPPFCRDITTIAKPGKNTLKVRITNLWVNRLIGDEQFPDDCEWNGKPLKRWPQWMVDGKPRPVPERLTFTTWKHYNRDSTPLDSGLLGPVLLRIGERAPIQ